MRLYYHFFHENFRKFLFSVGKTTYNETENNGYNEDGKDVMVTSAVTSA